MPSSRRKTSKTNRTKPDLVVGKIHAHWCGHCVALVPEWRKMKKILNSTMKKKRHLIFEEIEQSQEDTKIPRINRTHLARSSKKLTVQGGYPTVFQIRNGNVEYYGGQRTAEPMAQWFSNIDSALPREKPQSMYNMFGLGGGKTRKRRKHRGSSKKSN